MSADRFTIFKDETSPAIREVVTLEGEPVVFGVGDTVKLQGRMSGSTGPLKIDAAGTVDDPANGIVRYEWAAADTDTAGNLIAWWLLTLGGDDQSTPHFVVPIIDQLAADPGTGVYATVLDVKALGGFLAKAWKQAGTDVSEDDIATYLVLASSDIDLVLATHTTLPLDPTSAAAHGLRSLTADGALLRAINATWPSSLPGQILDARQQAQDRWTAGIEALKDGTHPVLDVLPVDGSAIDREASSLWTADPAYGLSGWCYGYPTDPLDYNPALRPGTYRDDVF